MARTTRTLGTLISSGVPILEALNITRETSNNMACSSVMYAKIYESIREGESDRRADEGGLSPRVFRCFGNALALSWW